MATLTLRQTRTITVDDRYQLVSVIIAADDMPLEVFVHYADGGAYSHVANLADMSRFPATTPSLTLGFYRLDTVTQIFDTPTEANNAALVHQERCDVLVGEFNTSAAGFDGVPADVVLNG